MVKAADVPSLPSGTSWKKVCVVDTGYENTHPDLPTLSTSDGFSPYGTTQKWDVDGNGHGTHCAGTIGAIGGNDVGVDSVMNTGGSGFENFFIGKGLQNSGGGSMSGVISAMNKCEEEGASVISMSLGGSGSNTAFRDAAKTLHEKGVLLVAAAGNGGNSRFSYPASYDHVMSVAAVASNRVRASFSRCNTQYGHGIADAKAAYDYLQANPCNSWPPEFQDNAYVKSGCYVPANDTPMPTPSPESSAPSSAPVAPPSSAPIEGCEGWCNLVTVPWKPASTGA